MSTPVVGPDGRAWRSVSALARELGCSPSAIYHWVTWDGGRWRLRRYPDPRSIGRRGGNRLRKERPMAIPDEMTAKGWHNVQPTADGRWRGQSEPEDAAYSIAVDGDAEGRIKGVVISHRPDPGTHRIAPRLPVAEVPTPDRAAGMHEDALAAKHKEARK